MGWVISGVCQSVLGDRILLGGDTGVAHHGCSKGRNESSCKPYITMLETEFSDGTLQ